MKGQPRRTDENQQPNRSRSYILRLWRVDEPQAAGCHTVTWDASELSGGIYLYRLEAESFVETKAMMLLR